MLEEGQKAPAFALEAVLEAAVDGAFEGAANSDGPRAKVSTSDFRGKQALVVYFYPKDDTPGCTRQAQAFHAAAMKLEKAGAAVVGISKDSIASHCKFRDKYGLGFPLLSDPDQAVHKAYGAFGEKTLYGKKSMGTIRSTFVIDTKGNIAKIFRNVKVDGHVDAVLEALAELKR